MKLNRIEKIKGLIADGELKRAIGLLQGFNKKFFISISREYKAMDQDHVYGNISREQFNQFCNQLTSRILSELDNYSPQHEDTPQGLKDEQQEISKQRKGKDPMASDRVNIDPNENGSDGVDILEELTLLSLSLDFFDWSQRDYREKLGALLVSIDLYLRMLSNDAILFSELRLQKQLHRVREQNQQTKAFLSRFRTVASEELLTRTKNIEIPKLATQLESLVDRLVKN